MNDDELGRLLAEAFDAQARGSVGSERMPPAPRFASTQSSIEDHPIDGRPMDGRPMDGHGHDRRRIARAALPLSAAAAVVVLVGLVLAFVNHGSGSPSASPHRVAASAGANTSGAPVHIKLLNADDSVVGVGMPVIAYFSKKITDARALQDATSVTVDGRPVAADWYFEPSAAIRGYPIEAHLRPQVYWPAHAKISVQVAAAGRSAGTGLHFADDLALDFSTGAHQIVTVNAKTNRLTLDSDGTRLSYPVSLGAPSTPTERGIKVIMAKGSSICMSGPGYNICGVKYTQRLTYGGEYLHSAPWNVDNIKRGIDSSNGCTNLLPADAAHLFDVLRVGDVVNYPNASGPLMQLAGGFGDWNVPWSTWLTGGLVRTH